MKGTQIIITPQMLVLINPFYTEYSPKLYMGRIQFQF